MHAMEMRKFLTIFHIFYDKFFFVVKTLGVYCDIERILPLLFYNIIRALGHLHTQSRGLCAEFGAGGLHIAAQLLKTGKWLIIISVKIQHLFLFCDVIITKLINHVHLLISIYLCAVGRLVKVFAGESHLGFAGSHAGTVNACAYSGIGTFGVGFLDPVNEEPADSCFGFSVGC